MIRAVDLFCGVGGLTHGLVRGGIRVVAGIDVDSNCRFPYECNNNATFVNKDASKLTGDDIRRLWRGHGHKMLAGCAPCQPFSTYSRKGRKTRADSKWCLVEEFARLALEAKPDYVTMENVPQLADHQVFAKFVEALTGYYVWHDVVECAHYGVPQTRKRLVLLASRRSPIRLLPPSSIKGPVQRNVRDTIGHLRRLTAGQGDKNDLLHSACKLSAINLRRIRASRPGGTWRDWDPSLRAPCHRRKTGDTYPSVYGRMEWDAPAPTITTQCFGYGNGRFGHPKQDRAITLREAALLQTFPEDYTFLAAGERVRFNVLGRLIGNAVPVRLGEVIAQSIVMNAVLRTSATPSRIRANERKLAVSVP